MFKINYFKRVFLIICFICFGIFLTGGKKVKGLTKDEITALKKPIYDYVEGWYDKDEERMKQGLHPDLVKRSMKPGAKNGIDQFSLESLLAVVQKYGGDGGGNRRIDIEILDVSKKIAVAKVTSNSYVDYMQLGYWNDQWWIINVLWEFR